MSIRVLQKKVDADINERLRLFSKVFSDLSYKKKGELLGEETTRVWRVFSRIVPPSASEILKMEALLVPYLDEAKRKTNRKDDTGIS